jgi:hypothetical protein
MTEIYGETMGDPSEKAVPLVYGIKVLLLVASFSVTLPVWLPLRMIVRAWGPSQMKALWRGSHTR